MPGMVCYEKTTVGLEQIHAWLLDDMVETTRVQEVECAKYHIHIYRQLIKVGDASDPQHHEVI
eukprot:11823532-Prorocentrum_lima.AAC.1